MTSIHSAMCSANEGRCGSPGAPSQTEGKSPLLHASKYVSAEKLNGRLQMVIVVWESQGPIDVKWGDTCVKHAISCS